MNTYSSNNIKKIKKAYQKFSVDNLFFRDALNNMDEKNPLGIKMNLEKEMENMSKIFNTHEIINIKELGYPDHLDYKEAQDLVISWWQFTWKNKSSGKNKEFIANEIVKKIFSKKLNIFCQFQTRMAFWIKIFPQLNELKKIIS